MKDDDKTIRRRVVTRTLLHPLVLFPLMFGALAMTSGLLGLTSNNGMGLLGGAAGIVFGFGAYAARMAFKGRKLTEQVQAELLREQKSARDAELDRLDQALASDDRDPRPEGVLRDLRAMVEAFRSLDEASLGPNVIAAVEIRIRVEKLFDHCVSSLRQTRSFWATARKLSSMSARQPLLEQREEIIKDVQATLRQLSVTLVGLQTLDHSRNSPRQLQRMRDELDQTLESARTVESRVDQLLNDRGYDPSEFSEPSTPQVKG